MKYTFNQIKEDYQNLMLNEQYLEAQILCENLLEKNPKCKEASKALADVFFAKKLNHKAGLILKNTLNKDDSGHNLDVLVSDILSSSENVFFELYEARKDYQEKSKDENAIKKYAVVLCSMDFYEDACNILFELLELNKNVEDAHEIMSYSLGQLYDENPEKAKKIAQKWNDCFPQNPIVKHISKSILGGNVSSCSIEYIANIFDSHSENFDNLMQKLFYKTPKVVNHIINEIKTKLPENPTIIDVGCGTGLCGKYLKSVVNEGKLWGVDCSEKMLFKAEKTGFYDVLIKDDLIGFLADNSICFNLIVAADVLVYSGELEVFFDLSFKNLNKKGFLLASFELMKNGINKEYFLQVNGRYQHDLNYINDAAKKAGFVIVKNEFFNLRKEKGSPVSGVMVVAQKK